MVSTGPTTLFGRILRIGYCCGFTQVGLDRRGKCWKYERNMFRYIWVRMQLAMAIGYHLFLIYRSCLAYKDPKMGVEQKMEIQYITILYILVNASHVGILNGAHFVSLINGYQGFVKFQLKNDLPKSRTTKMFALVILMIDVLAMTPRILEVILRPETPQSLTSLSSNPKQLSIGTTLLAALTTVIILGFQSFQHWLQTTTIFNFAHDLVTTMKLLQKSSRSNPIRMARQQRALYVIQRNCSALYGHFTLATHLIGFVAVVRNLYKAVVLGSLRSLILAVGLFTAFTSFWRVLGDVHETSKEVLMDWRRSEASKKSVWLPRFLRSCRPINIPLGSFFYVDRGFVLTFAAVVVDTAASLILAK